MIKYFRYKIACRLLLKAKKEFEMKEDFDHMMKGFRYLKWLIWIMPKDKELAAMFRNGIYKVIATI